MTRYRYNTATTLDGFLADDADSLDWLLKQDFDDGGPGGFSAFMAGVGAQVMGATTYEWILDHEKGAWTYTAPTFVFTHRDLEPVNETVTMVAGEPTEHRAEIEAAAGDKDVWMVGGGDLAAAFARPGCSTRSWSASPRSRSGLGVRCTAVRSTCGSRRATGTASSW